jgi:hypothetical protein
MRLMRLVRQGHCLVVFPRKGRAFGGGGGDPRKGPTLYFRGKTKGGKVSFVNRMVYHIYFFSPGVLYGVLSGIRARLPGAVRARFSTYPYSQVIRSGAPAGV